MAWTKQYILGMFLLVALRGLLDAFPANVAITRGANYVFSFTYGSLVYLWCKADAEARAYPITDRNAFLTGVFGFVGAGVYLLATQPAKKAALSFGRGLGILLLQGVTYLLMFGAGKLLS
ncbi:hypothetical protein [Deinococcus misasensis]|uniref:hypothetical protein n=1 Tax=Deinococcus misasensis TaxID=392413 RepID=UPI0005539DAE|nr:hypothetical protein [Deinococcus misasensis]